MFLALAIAPADARSPSAGPRVLPEVIAIDDAPRDNRPTLMFVEYRQPAKYVGVPNICPGSSPGENQEEILCVAELYQGPAERLRHLSGPKIPRNMRLRLTAHSAYKFLRPGTLLLVAARPFADQGTEGVFAQWWMRADDDGRFCLREGELAGLGLEKLRRKAKLTEERDLNGHVSRHHCLKP